ncbi:agnoprotein [simian adenovirus 7]|uniref:Agnoprotein n=1 Tax=Simian adenovirus serotype 7 TaxID=10532 RepID=Q0PLZ1_ADES7|nr:agnoprotein [Simian adenovirus 7]
MGVNVVEVEVPPAHRAFVLMFVKATAVVAALHALYLLNEMRFSPAHQKPEGEVETGGWWGDIPFALAVGVCVCVLLLWVDDGGDDDAPGAASPDLRHGGVQALQEGTQLPAVQGVEGSRAEVGGKRLQVHFQKTGKSVSQVQMVLDFQGGVG